MHSQRKHIKEHTEFISHNIPQGLGIAKRKEKKIISQSIKSQINIFI